MVLDKILITIGCVLRMGVQLQELADILQAGGRGIKTKMVACDVVGVRLNADGKTRIMPCGEKYDSSETPYCSIKKYTGCKYPRTPQNILSKPIKN